MTDSHSVQAFAFNVVLTNVLLVTGFFLLYRYYQTLKNRLDRMRWGYKYLDGSEAKILYKHFHYYRKLSPVLKKVYENRVAHFMHSKDYIDGEGNEVPVKKRILIAAYAAQLTFGLKDFHFDHFTTVVVYPTSFFSRVKQQFSSWEVDPEGSISLSWKEFYFGLKDQQSFTPIGLKIMAHVMKIENELQQDGPLKISIKKEFNPIENSDFKTEKNSIFQPLELASNDQFFIACLVNFFEKPVEFKNQYPGLFRDIDRMLHHDVLRTAS